MISFADSLAHKPFILGEVGFEKYVEPNIKRYEADPYASPDSQMRIYDYDYGVDMADVMAQAFNSGFDGVIAWGLDDAMHTNGDTGDKSQLKRWGMWRAAGLACGSPTRIWQAPRDRVTRVGDAREGPDAECAMPWREGDQTEEASLRMSHERDVPLWKISAQQICIFQILILTQHCSGSHAAADATRQSWAS